MWFGIQTGPPKVSCTIRGGLVPAPKIGLNQKESGFFRTYGKYPSGPMFRPDLALNPDQTTAGTSGPNSSEIV